VSLSVDDRINAEIYEAFCFKVKGFSHQMVKQDTPGTSLSIQVASSPEAFVDMFLTDARVEQGVIEACGGSLDESKRQIFLNWMRTDIKKRKWTRITSE